MLLKADKITKWYGNVLSADSLTFSIQRGDVVGLLGANGAGKSTIMNMISGCIPPTSGCITISELNMQEQPRKAKRLIGYLPEIPPLYSDMRVEEQLRFVASLRSIKQNNKRTEINRVCKLTNISDKKKQMIKHLSKGYKQRVGIAQALVGSPQLLILDEPTAGLDPKQIIDIRELIINLRKHHTIIISSHILSEISSVCTRMIIMKQGRIAADNTPEELRNTFTEQKTRKLFADAEQKHEKNQSAHTMEVDTAGYLPGQAIETHIRGTELSIRTILQQLEGIISFSITDSHEQGCFDALIICRKGYDIREKLFYSLAEASCPALNIKSVQPTLEEIFIELTT